MKHFLHVTLFIAALGLFTVGCEQSKNPAESSSRESTPSKGPIKTTRQDGRILQSVVFPESVNLAGFKVHFDSRSFVNNQTTFTYTVTGPGDDVHFRLELPACAPAFLSATPDNGVTSNNDAFINPGIEWHPSTGSGSTTSNTFSITYPGNIRAGIVLVSIKTLGATQVGQIIGACARVFDISGSVYTDGNSNAIRDGSETGIANATVTLCDAFSVPLTSTTTNTGGSYIFEALPAGSYLIKVDTTTVASTQTKYLGATTPTTLSVSVGPDSPGNNFGFAPKSSKLINDLKFGVLLTNGATPNFWKKQLQAAISGTGNAIVSKDSLLVYVSRIRSLLLVEPFQLGSDDGLQAALDILSRPIKTDLDALNQQLLALEFNHVSGHGILGTDPALQLILIGWGEALVAASSSITTTAASSTTSPTTDAAGVYYLINKSSGGGGSF
ncbi:MAG: hypothetical protein HYR76_11920 [Ignavibacteria bacterium]|nr:hypothetical protein [Ignavibacteria bacterium]